MIAQKNNIDSTHIIGKVVELKKQGNNHAGCCPFHEDKNPSFFVSQLGKFKCFGCGESGDVIDFVQKYYNLNFKEALKYLGIKNGKVTPKIRKEIQHRKQKNEALERFERWKGDYLTELGTLINRTENLLPGIALEDLHWYALLLDWLPIWQWHSNILLYGTDRDKFELYKEIKWNE